MAEIDASVEVEPERSEAEEVEEVEALDGSRLDVVEAAAQLLQANTRLVALARTLRAWCRRQLSHFGRLRSVALECRRSALAEEPVA